MALKYLLPVWSAIGVYTIIGIMQLNGTFKEISAVKETYVYPKTNVLARHDFTGIKGLDDLLCTLNVTFWPIIDGSSPSASLHSFYFAGTYGGALTLLYLESIRVGNQWKAASFITIAGLFAQTASYGVTVPLYLALQLWTSPKVSRTARDAIFVDPLQAKLIPVSIILGFILPVVMLVLPSPSPVSLEQKQIWITLWNIFPLIVTATLSILTALIGATQPKTTTYTKKSTLSSTRPVYAFAFAWTTFTHVISWSISISSLLFPALYSPRIVGDLHPAKVFLPIISHEYAEWPLGIHRLLQWDNFIGSTALLAWSVATFSNAYRVTHGKPHIPLVKLLGFTFISGFVGASAVLQLERDEILLGDDTAKTPKMLTEKSKRG